MNSALGKHLGSETITGVARSSDIHRASSKYNCFCTHTPLPLPCTVIVTKAGFVVFQAKMPFDDNKLYCSEVLSILLQNHEGKSREIFYVFSVSVVLLG